MRQKLLLLVLLFSAHLLWAENKDVIVLMDTSSSMFDSYKDVNDYLFTDLLKKHLNIGDHFYFISFDEKPNLEITRQINSKADIEQTLNQLLLIQPLGEYTDLLLALDYLHQYTSDLAPESQKVILVLTDGIHDPPPGSSYVFNSQEALKEAIKKKGDILRQEGWNINLIQINEKQDDQIDIEVKDSTSDLVNTEEESSSQTDSKGKTSSSNSINPALNKEEPKDNSEPLGTNVYEDLSNELNTPVVNFEQTEDMSEKALGLPRITMERDLGIIKRSGKIKIHLINNTNQANLIKIRKLFVDNRNVLASPVDIFLDPQKERNIKLSVDFPSSIENGQQQDVFRFNFAKGFDATPNNFVITYELKENGFFDKNIVLIIATLFVGVLVIIILFSVFLKISHSMSLPLASRNREQENVVHNSRASYKEEQQKQTALVSDNDISSQTRNPSVKRTSLSTSGGSSSPTANSLPLRTEKKRSHVKKGQKISLASLSNNSDATDLSSPSPQHYGEQRRETPYKPPIMASLDENGLPKALLMRVFMEGGLVEQNRYQGNFNTKYFQDGQSHIVGGRNHSFKIFLKPINGYIGKITLENGHYNFYRNQSNNNVLNTEELIKDCVGVEIKVKSKTNQILSIYFEPYRSPLDELNALMRQVRSS